MTQLEAEAAIWAAIENVAGKQYRRDMLTAGGEHDVTIRVSGVVRGKELKAAADCHLAVGHDKEQLRSEAAPIDHLVGF